MKAVFLDRDGVINEYPGDFEYVKSWSEFKFLPGVAQALKKINNKGYKIFVISNQAGVGKGLYTKSALDLLTTNMISELAEHGVEISKVNYCTHRKEEDCLCRKPKTGLIDAIIKEIRDSGQDIDLNNSFFIGDTIRDIKTGKAAGLKTILVFSGKEKQTNNSVWETRPDFTAGNLSEAADKYIK